MFNSVTLFLGNPAHKGGVYAVSWSPDGKQLLTASGDKTCKIWNVADMSVVSVFNMGNNIEDQQVSCLWQGEHLLSVSLAGHITYLDPSNPEKPRRIVKVLFFCYIHVSDQSPLIDYQFDDFCFSKCIITIDIIFKLNNFY